MNENIMLNIAIAFSLLFAMSFCSSFQKTQCAGVTVDQAYRDSTATALVRAAVKGKTSEVERLVKAGADPNYLEEGSVPMLIWTLCAQNKKGYEALLKMGADPNLGGTGEGFAGTGFIGNAYMRRSRSLIEKGWSATVLAAAIEDPFYLRLALQYGGDVNAIKGDSPSHRPLLQAAHEGLFDNVKILLAAGADINTHDNQYDYYTAPIQAIASFGRFDIVAYLLEQGYNHNLEDLRSYSSYRATNQEMKPYREKVIQMLKDRGVE